MDAKALGISIRKQAPLAASIVSSGGVIATAYFAAKGGAKAKCAIDKAEKATGRKVSLVDKVKLTWKYYIPATICGSLTIFAIGTSFWMSKRVQANMLGAYAALDQTYKKYQNKVKELYGDETHAKILQDINIPAAKDPQLSGYCFGTECGTSFDVNEEIRTFYDAYSGQYFKASIGQVMLAELHLNRNFVLMGEVPLTMWYEFLGIDPPEEADKKCWTIEDEYFFIDFQHYKTTTDDGFECCVVEFAIDPYPCPY